MRQHGGSGGAVAGHIGGLGGDFLHHLRAHILELVFQFDFLGNRHAVLGHSGSTEGFVEQHVTATRAERYLNGVGENIDAAHHARAGIITEFDIFCSHGEIPLKT